MSHFAPVCPINVLREMSPAAAGAYHLLLAHDVAKNSRDYTNYFHMRNFTVIMDNSVIELGGAVDLGTIREACLAVKVTTVVLPDVLLDGKATVESCTKALREWPSALGDIIPKEYGGGFMYVPQGKTIEEFAESARALADHPGINYWGVPRNLVAQVGTRRDAIDIVSALNRQRKIHLLGFSDNIIDDVLSARDRRIEGIDSAVPIRAASLGKEMAFDLQMPPRGDWWDVAEHIPLMDRNAETFRSWIAWR